MYSSWGDGELLAISATPHPELFVEATAYVMGEVRLFDLQDIERTTGVDLDDALRRYQRQPVILIESVSMNT